jgi:hypothetical protein
MQLLVLGGLTQALDINYCAPDNTGADFQFGKSHLKRVQT